MSGSVFTPKIKNSAEVRTTPASVVQRDTLGTAIHRFSQYGILALFVAIPLGFTPGVWATLGFDKVLVVTVLLAIITIATSFLALRMKVVHTAIPLALVAFWGLFLLSVAAAFLSDTTRLAIQGSVFETQTVGFFFILALLLTVPLVMQDSKVLTLKALFLFGGSSVAVLLYVVLRFVFGADALPFGSFPLVTDSMVGSFTDLGIFAALSVLLGLVMLVQFPLGRITQVLVASVVLLSLSVVVVVNLLALWIMVGFFGLLLFVYILSRDNLFADPENPPAPVSVVLIASIAVVCITSALFVVAGDYAQKQVSKLVDVSYGEVRLSLGTTLDITRAVYAENILLGAGPNQFVNAWTQHKEASINNTVFWNTQFTAGNSFIATVFVNLGLLGGALFVTFHFLYVYAGYKMLLRTNNTDQYWYSFGVITFTAAAFLWIITYVYVPGATILLLAALFTGLSFASFAALVPNSVKSIPLANSQAKGFVLMAMVIVLIAGTIAGVFAISQQHGAQTQFARAQATASSVSEFEQSAKQAYEQYPDGRFAAALAEIQAAKMAQIINSAAENADATVQLPVVSEQALLYASLAIEKNKLQPQYYALLAQIQANLAVVGAPQFYDQATQALNIAKRLDPVNPQHYVLLAQIAIAQSDKEAARSAVKEAIRLKGDYTQALFLSTQLDISDGNTQAAIDSTRALISLEPNNQTRYFQLGVLLSAQEDFPGAIAAYEAAVALDPGYANARYFLALSYINVGNNTAAVEQLKIVRETNPDNAELERLIRQIETGQDVGFDDARQQSLLGEESNVVGVATQDTQDQSGELSTVEPDQPQ